jgi:hypothetical protein
MDDERKISVPNTVGELIDFLKQFPKDTTLYAYKTEGYYDGSESTVLSMSYEHYESLGSMSITFH